MNNLIYSIFFAIALYFITINVVKKYYNKNTNNKFIILLNTLSNNNLESVILIVSFVAISLYMGELLNNGLLINIIHSIKKFFIPSCNMDSYVPNYGSNKVYFMKGFPNELM